MPHLESDRQFRDVSLNPALAPIICAALLYAVSWAFGCSGSRPASSDSGGPKLESRDLFRPAPEGPDDKVVRAISGRRLTIARMSQRGAISLEFSNPEYGIAFDAPRGYLLKEGDLPQMDRGLGYLGPIPMHFVDPGGVRVATVEAPPGLHVGSNFMNEFFTVSVHYGSSAPSCEALDIAPESRGAVITRNVDAIAFRGFEEHTAASLHQYTGIFLHGYAQETCYEIGYGVVTLDAESSGGLKRLDSGAMLATLEKILDSMHIAPPDFERFTETE